MENEGEEIRFKVAIDEGATEARVKAINQQLLFFKETAKGLSDDLKKGIVTQKQYDEAMGRIDKQTQILNKDLTVQKGVLASIGSEQKIATGSLMDMQKASALATESYFNLSKAQRESAEVGGLLKARINELNEEIETEKKALDNSKKGVVDYVRQINIMGVNVGETADSFKSGAQGVGGFTKAIFTARGALTALAAVPIVLVLTAIIAFFKSTDEGADKLEQGIGYLTAAFDGLMKGLAPIGKFLVDIFTAPLETIKKLTKGTDDYNFSLSKTIEGAHRAGLANAEYVDSMQKLEDAENALIVTRAKVALQVDQALLKTKDRSLSEKQRIKILNDAGKAEDDLAKKTEANAKKALDTVNKRNAAYKEYRELTDKETLAAANAEAAYVNAQRESLNIGQTIQNRRSALEEKAEADRKARADKALEAQRNAAQDRLALAEVNLIDAKRKGKDLLEYEIKVIEQRLTVENVGLKKGSAQRQLNEIRANTEIFEKRVAHVARLAQLEFDAAQDRNSAQLTLSRKGSAEELALQQDALKLRLDKEKAAAVDAANQNAELRKGLTKRLRALDAQYNADKEALDRNFEDKEINRKAELEQLTNQTALDRSNNRLSIQRNAAVESINIEEKRLLDLLELQRKSGELSEEDFKTRRDAIKAAAEVRRKSEYKNILNDEINDDLLANQNLLNQLTNQNDFWRDREFETRHKDLEDKRKQELLFAEGNGELINEINTRYNKQQADLNKEHLLAQVEAITNILSQSANVLSEVISARFNSLFAELDTRQKAALESAGLNADLREKIEEQFDQKRTALEAEQAKKQKALAKFNVLLATAQAIAKASPILPLMLLAGAVGAAQLIAIESAQVMAKGGIVDGPSHAQGGVKYRLGNRNVELEGGEGVINKRSMAMPGVREQASRLNQLGGGVAFTARMPIQKYTFFASGGPIPTPNYGIAGMGTDSIRQTRDLANLINNVQTVLVVDNLNQVQASRDRVQRRAQIK